ncbi:MAG: hypothetical protein HY616_04020 [Candidatus Rokubacteria bacterium]|nr:hypothetical protein [Candidatus Rokubacteria bacterium]
MTRKNEKAVAVDASGAERLEDDPDVGVARARRVTATAAAEAARAEVRALLPDDGRTPVTIRFLMAQERARDAEVALEAVEREVESAERAARERIAEARRPGLVALDRDVLEAAEDLLERIAARSRYAAETAERVGFAPGPSAAAALRGPLEAAINSIRRELDPPAEVPAPGPRDGEARCKVLITNLIDRRGGMLRHHSRNDVLDLPRDADLERLVREGAVELVSA